MNTDFEKQIENLPKKGNSIKDKLFNKDYFLRSTEFGVLITEKEEIIFESKKSSIGNFVLAGTAAIGVSFRFKESIISYSAIIIILIVMTLGYFFTLKRKSKQIKIDKIGFETMAVASACNSLLSLRPVPKVCKSLNAPVPFVLDSGNCNVVLEAYWASV